MATILINKDPHWLADSFPPKQVPFRFNKFNVNKAARVETMLRDHSWYDGEHDPATTLTESEEYGMSWDGRRGQWINIVYRYHFPGDPFLRPDDWRTGRSVGAKSQPVLFQFKPAARDETLLAAQPTVIPFSSPKPIRQQRSRLTRPRFHEPSPLILNSHLQSDLEEAGEEEGDEAEVVAGGLLEEEEEDDDQAEVDREDVEQLAAVFTADQVGDNWDEEAFEDFMNSAVSFEANVGHASNIFQRPLPLTMASLDGVRLYHSETNHQPWISSCPSSPPPPLFALGTNADPHQLLSDLQLNLS